jgi:hypothetical protein
MEENFQWIVRKWPVLERIKVENSSTRGNSLYSQFFRILILVLFPIKKSFSHIPKTCLAEKEKLVWLLLCLNFWIWDILLFLALSFLQPLRFSPFFNLHSLLFISHSFFQSLLFLWSLFSQSYVSQIVLIHVSSGSSDRLFFQLPFKRRAGHVCRGCGLSGCAWLWVIWWC